MNPDPTQPTGPSPAALSVAEGLTDAELRQSALEAVARCAGNMCQEMVMLGWGMSKEKPLPGTFDNLITALANLQAANGTANTT